MYTWDTLGTLLAKTALCDFSICGALEKHLLTYFEHNSDSFELNCYMNL